MAKDRGIVYIQKLPKVWKVWFPGEHKARRCYPQPKEFWKRTKIRLEKKGYVVLEIAVQELPPIGSS